MRLEWTLCDGRSVTPATATGFRPLDPRAHADMRLHIVSSRRQIQALGLIAQWTLKRYLRRGLTDPGGASRFLSSRQPRQAAFDLDAW